MITLADVRDWLKTYGVAEHYYAGKLDNKLERSVGVYQRTRSGSPVTAIGGRELSSYEVKSISVLIHWNQNAVETERASYALFNALLSEKDLKINGTQIYYIRLNVPEPVDIGTDDKGVYERVIEFDLFFKRSDT